MVQGPSKLVCDMADEVLFSTLDASDGFLKELTALCDALSRARLELAFTRLVRPAPLPHTPPLASQPCAARPSLHP